VYFSEWIIKVRQMLHSLTRTKMCLKQPMIFPLGLRAGHLFEDAQMGHVHPIVLITSQILHQVGGTIHIFGRQM
jgi:hypothetical protein